MDPILAPPTTWFRGGTRESDLRTCVKENLALNRDGVGSTSTAELAIGHRVPSGGVRT